MLVFFSLSLSFSPTKSWSQWLICPGRLLCTRWEHRDSCHEHHINLLLKGHVLNFYKNKCCRNRFVTGIKQHVFFFFYESREYVWLFLCYIESFFFFYYVVRHLTPSSTTCLPSSSPCRLPTDWRVSETTWSFSFTFTSDGMHTLTQTHTHTHECKPQLTRFPLLRLYPVDKTRVNEYGISYDDKPKRKSHKD